MLEHLQDVVNKQSEMIHQLHYIFFTWQVADNDEHGWGVPSKNPARELFHLN